uniref:Transporter n=1 Tax=Sinonovacula rivularis TaxID=489091 RepID=A0AA49X8G0_9BIVA|nr:NTT3 [Sinonovacula rivularis]
MGKGHGKIQDKHVELEHLGKSQDVVNSNKDETMTNEQRGTWAGELDFVLACIGFAVGLGNIWRFPYLCYKNGGGAFLVPYMICLLTCGMPVLLLEFGLGQYMAKGSVAAWGNIAPAFQGIGIASLVITFLMNIYYIVVLAWTGHYFISSMSAILPWSHCKNSWNTPRCFAGKEIKTTTNISSIIGQDNKTVDATVEYWERGVLRLSGGIDEPGQIVWQLAVSLACVWVLVYFCVWRGVRWTGKVVYFTALFPYVILTCLIIRGITLDGAADGLVFYFKPDFSRLGDSQVWIDGATQIFFSYAIALGAMITLGSYNKFHNNFFRDCIVISCFNTGTSLYGGVAVFSALGYMAKQQNMTVGEVAESGPGLVFIAYPKAVSQMPFPQLWAVLFFFMVLLIGLDSQFVGVEGFLTPIMDMFPRHLYKMKNRILLTGVYCLLNFLLGLSMVTEGGMYVFQLFDYYSASGLVLLWVCFFEATVISWVFGADRFMDAFEIMIGRRISVAFVVCWKIITPIITLGAFLFMLVTFTPLTYNKTYIYPRVAQGLGLCMALISIACIPAVFLYRMVQAQGSLVQRWKHLTTPVLQKHQVHDKWRAHSFS